MEAWTNEGTSNVEIIRIQAGEYQATDGPAVLQTLLGSCVSACLYDPVNRVIGMNHFLLAGIDGLHNQKLMQSRAGYYGIHAMELLINAMLKLGANRFQLKAKMFGGANVLTHYTKDMQADIGIGAANSEFLTRFLAAEKIPLVASDVGGHAGRVIQFRASDYKVLMRTVSHAQENQVAQQEHDYWRRQVSTKSRMDSQIDFFDNP